MRYHVLEQSDSYPIAILVKSSAFTKTELLANYFEPLIRLGIPADEMMAVAVPYNEHGKAPAGFIKDYLGDLLADLKDSGVKTLYVADAAYFKVLTSMARADPHLGYVIPAKHKPAIGMDVVLGLNYQALIYNPALESKLKLSLKTLADHHQGTYKAIGSNIIHSALYPTDDDSIVTVLSQLHQHPALTCDIEAFSLRFWEAGIGTISFAWNEHNGVSFPCDYREYSVRPSDDWKDHHGYKQINQKVRAALRQFFENYEGKLIFHKSDYDVQVLIYSLWMKDPLDQPGLLKGLEIMTRLMDDTKVIAYLATNSTAGNVLGLKALAHEFAGNWAVEVSDIRKVPLKELLRYNLVDALSTQYVWKKYYPIMVQDNQLELYQGLMLDSLKLIIQMQLTGMPMCEATLARIKQELTGLQAQHLSLIDNSPLVLAFNKQLQVEAMTKANAKLKVKQHPLEKFKDIKLNPNSGPQLQVLLYEILGLPIIDLTDTKLPATGGETLDKLINHTQDPQIQELLRALIDYSQVTKILSTFIPAFEAGLMKVDGRRYLHGSFNLGGTVSGRLSSSDPNMQNLPAGTTGSAAKQMFGKMIKEVFQAAFGWIFAGADFNSLEDYISALTTKDPNKLNVYVRGFDGHCLRAAYYYRDQLGHIDLDDPASVNAIKKTHPKLRQNSKTPTFALTYQGTYHTLMVNEGWDEETAKRIEKAYHDLYKVSDEYIQTRLQQASKDGFITVAFGLRVRTPLLKQVMFGQKGMPYEAAAEGRTAGNAMGQSYGLLNNRAAVAFFKEVWKSKHRYSILPVALIHDAIYILIKDDVEVVEFANRELIKAMQWQELPEIQHPTVKLGAALDLYWPSWASAITLPNNADQATIRKLCDEAKAEILKAA